MAADPRHLPITFSYAKENGGDSLVRYQSGSLVQFNKFLVDGLAE